MQYDAEDEEGEGDGQQDEGGRQGIVHEVEELAEKSRLALVLKSGSEWRARRSMRVEATKVLVMLAISNRAEGVISSSLLECCTCM